MPRLWTSKSPGLKEWREHCSRAHSARAEATAAKQRGTLVSQPCEICGATERIHMHHEDYDKPLEVRWLCARHHADVHAGRLTLKPTGSPIVVVSVEMGLPRVLAVSFQQEADAMGISTDDLMRKILIERYAPKLAQGRAA